MSVTAEQFLKNLHRGLKWRVPLNEAEDIIRDYQEYFDEEQKLGKTEEQIIAALGSPQQVIKTITAEHRKEIRFSPSRLCLIFAVLGALVFPVTELIPYLYNNFLLALIRYPATPCIFVLLAPLPASLHYSLQHTSGRSTNSKFHARLNYGAAVLSLILFCVMSVNMFMFLKQIYNPNFNVEDGLAFNTYIPQLATTLFVGFVWLSGIFLSHKFGRYFPALYFLYAAIHVSLAQFYDVLAFMNYQDHSMPFEHLAFNTFFPVAMIFLCAAVGAAFWCGLQYYLGKRGGR
jgi:uncharacterized membrane protein